MRTISGVLALLLMGTAAWGQVDTGLLTPWPEGRHAQVGGRAMIFGDSQTDNGDADFDLNVYEARGCFRLGDDDSGAPSAGFRVKYLDISTDDPALPTRLVDQAIGLGMGVGHLDAFGQTWQLGFTAGIGYAGDTPFADSDAVYLLGNLVAKAQLDEKSELRLILNYDGNRAIFPDVPLPYIAYTRKENDAFTWTVGFPFSGIRWQIDDRLLLTARYFFPLDGEIELAYELHKEWTLYVGYESSLDAFHLDTPDDDDDRLFFQQRRVEAGVRWAPGAWPGVELTVAGGYAFDQEFETGWDLRDTDSVADVDGTPFGRVALSVEF